MNLQKIQFKEYDAWTKERYNDPNRPKRRDSAPDILIKLQIDEYTDVFGHILNDKSFENMEDIRQNEVRNFDQKHFSQQTWRSLFKKLD